MDTQNTTSHKKPRPFIPDEDTKKQKRRWLGRQPRLVYVAAAFGVIGIITLVSSFAYNASNGDFEAESAVINPTSALGLLSDANASGGKAAAFYSNATLSQVTTTPAITAINIRARGNQCKGSPAMTVKVDSQTIMVGTPVSSSSYANYPATISLAAGSHTVSISFINDYKSRRCDRNLFIDKVEFTPVPTQTSNLVAPVITLNSDGKTISFTKVADVASYYGAIVSDPFNTRLTTYPLLSQGNSLTYDTTTNRYTWAPTPMPGQTINYGLRTAVDGSSWAKEITINWPTEVTTTPSVSNMVVGVTGNGWGLDAAKDTATLFKNFRFDNESSEPTSDYTNQGVKLNVLFPGPYSSGGVSSLNASTWVSNALSWYKANCTPANCPSIEILNEPGGTWFWGSSALSTTNAMAYVNLLKLVNSQFTATYGSSRPKIIASYDGSNGLQWGRTVWSVDSTVGNYVDGISVHPYGGNSNVTASALGNRQMVIDAHNETNKPVYVTEVGWPTAVGQPSTGDSLQWTEGSQATNIYNFLTWAKGTGYVPAVYLFNYRDYGTNNWYGVERWQQNNGTILGSKKPSWTAISQWLQGQTCTVCQ